MANSMVGTGPDQLLPNSQLGTAAFQDLDDLLVLTGAVLTLDQVRGTPGLTARAIVVTDTSARGLFYRDIDDTTTTDDGRDCLVSQEGVRWKRSVLLRRYTPTSSLDAQMTHIGACSYDDTRLYVRTASNAIKFFNFDGTL